MLKTLQKCGKFFEKEGLDGCASMAVAAAAELKEFRPRVPLVVALCNPGMRERHWELLSQRTGLQLRLDDPSLTLNILLQTGIGEHVAALEEVGTLAAHRLHPHRARALNSGWLG